MAEKALVLILWRDLRDVPGQEISGVRKVFAKKGSEVDFRRIDPANAAEYAAICEKLQPTAVMFSSSQPMFTLESTIAILVVVDGMVCRVKHEYSSFEPAA